VDANETASQAEATPPPHSQNWARRLGIGVLGVLALLTVVVLYRHRVAADRLRQALEELDRTEPGWRQFEIEAVRHQVADSENSALVVVDAVARLPLGWLSKDLEGLPAEMPPELLAPEDFARLQAALRPLDPALETARTLADRPYGRFAIFYARNPFATRLSDQQKAREVARLLAYDVRQLAQVGDVKAAVRSCRAGLNAARALGDEPILISQLMRITGTTLACQSIERTLALGEPDPRDLEELQQLLQLEDQTNLQLPVLRGERAALHQVCTILETGEVNAEWFFRDIGLPSTPLDRYLPWKTRYDILCEHPLFLSLLTERIAAAHKPLHEQVVADRDFKARVDALRLSRSTRLAAIPYSVMNFGEAHHRFHALLRCQVALVAAERFPCSEGKWPERLEQLRPRFLSEVPLDPFDGEPLRYKRLADGVIAYSVGPDGADNGGNLDRQAVGKPGTDLGYQLWDVPQRRQKPRPAAAVTPAR
jgi:hypothetical protein